MDPLMGHVDSHHCEKSVEISAASRDRFLLESIDITVSN
jgi:hypothetical protein